MLVVSISLLVFVCAAGLVGLLYRQPPWEARGLAAASAFLFAVGDQIDEFGMWIPVLILQMVVAVTAGRSVAGFVRDRYRST